MVVRPTSESLRDAIMGVITGTRIVRHGDADAFLRRASRWLLRAEVENSVILGMVRRAQLDEELLYAVTVEQDDAVVGCAVRTPPQHLVLSQMPSNSVFTLTLDVAACDDTLTGVHGPDAAAREFAYHWCDRHGCTAQVAMSHRLHRADRIRLPVHMPTGELRFATDHDTEIAASWLASFAGELGVSVPTDLDFVTRRIALREVVLWWDTQPRAIAVIVGRSPNGVRIGYVYTPPEWRGRGYAGACVGALSQRALDDGAAFCCLYTDVTNSVSNALYARLGYEPVSEMTDFEFVKRSRQT